MPLEIFCCYARKDQPFLNELKSHLISLQRQGLITVWADTDINAGAEWESEINKHLDTADIILLLVSSDFMASEYCYSKEMKRAIDRHEQGEAYVIPIILRPVYWQKAPFGKLQALPKDRKPVKSWPNLDKAFFDVTEGILKIVEEITLKRRTEDEWYDIILGYYKSEHFREALTACNQAIQLHPHVGLFYFGKGLVLISQRRYNEALMTFEKIIQFDPSSAALAYDGKGRAFLNLKRYSEALDALDQGIQLDPNNAYLYNNKGLTLLNLKRYSEALDALDQGIQLKPNVASFYFNRGKALIALERYEEALIALDQSIQLNPGRTAVSNYKKLVLERLGRAKEAQ